jgi:hypothetical protein
MEHNMADSLFSKPKAVDKLRKYYQESLSEINTDEVIRELHGESDRAKVILSSTILEDMLDYCIERRVVVDASASKFRYIFRFEGPLGTFSSKIEIAYIFGFITRSLARQLHLMREMRNACAHSKFRLSFDAPELADVVKLIFHPIGMTKLKEDTPEGIRTTFLEELTIILQTLIHGATHSGGGLASPFP